MEQGDVPEVGDEGDEEPEEIVGEEEGDMAEEELEDVHEELEGEEGEGHEHEHEHEHAEMVDEEEEHHELVKERRKCKEFEVFVGGLDKDASEADLRKAFAGVGEVTEVRLMMNPQTKKNKGFAFLRFATVEQARRAVTELKHPVINGKQCGVTPSQDSDTLFLGNICKTWTKNALREKLKHYGVDSVEDLTVVEDTNNEGMNRGFAFLEFSSRSDAMDAFKRLQKRDIVFGVDRPAKVSFADSFIDPGDEIMAQAKVRARLSRPLQRGKGRHVGRGDYRSSRGVGRVVRGSWGHPASRGLRGVGSRIPPASVKRPVELRDRRPMMSSYPPRGRPLPPPARSYDRRPPVPAYPKSSFKREYSRREDLPPPRSRAASDYGSRAVQERHQSYLDDYTPRGPAYSDPPRITVKGVHVNMTISGSKRPYAALDDVPSHYADVAIRQSRLGRSSMGYGSSRTSQDSHGPYSSRQGIDYGGGSYGGNGGGGMYSSSSGSDVGGSSYSSMYSGRCVGGSSYKETYWEIRKEDEWKTGSYSFSLPKEYLL
ncbi:hypothetical protein C1H46_016196 [Malus baccata]|uniref:RRM domain-containing protein n=1 Tax=Malus baccata TaxID=106549 RepID=A0A540MHF0_MALBA|nr:hypothetical protein C1H46_016196 [Malus baccata]